MTVTFNWIVFAAILASVIVTVAIAVILAVYLPSRKRAKSAASSFRTTVDARVVSRRESRTLQQDPEYTEKMRDDASDWNFVMFETEDGSARMELAVSRITYENVRPGDRGKLTLQGTTFISFVKD